MLTKFKEITSEIEKVIKACEDGYAQGMRMITEAYKKDTRRVANFNVCVLPCPMGIPPMLRKIMEVPFAGAMKAGNEFLIVVNEGFFRLSEASQEAILWHEAGHHHLGHTSKHFISKALSNKTRNWRAMIGMFDKDELAADAYAAEHVGNLAMAAALEELINDIDKRMDNPILQVLMYSAKKEVDHRIAALTSAI